MPQVHDLFLALQGPAAALGISTAAEPAIEGPMPVQIRKSIWHEALIGFDDDKPNKAWSATSRHTGWRRERVASATA